MTPAEEEALRVLREARISASGEAFLDERWGPVCISYAGGGATLKILCAQSAMRDIAIAIETLSQSEEES